MNIESKNPATGELIKAYEPMISDEVERRIAAADEAQRDWKNKTIEARAEPLRVMADLLEARAESLGRIAVLEMGKPLAEAVGEVKKCAWVCRHYADHSAEYLAPAEIASDASKSYLRYDPLGLVLSVMPWNFPYWQVFRFAAPTLMAGNGGLLKHAPNVPQCA